MRTASPMTDREISQLGDAIEEIVKRAQGMGLDFFEMRYEICPADVLHTFGAYGMPTRFSHWSFGKAFHLLKSQADVGLAKIYELVINSDPCYAFLLESNSLLENMMIAAHVLAHSDFFKQNWRFQETNRAMIHSMSAFANRVLQYEHDYGRDRVERFLDAALAIAQQVDPYPRNLREPGRDLPLFMLERAPELEDWQRDILASLREEALYFRPQMETKILNEGWASLWHARIMREMSLTPAQSLEFARLHASVLAPHPYQLNPYRLGYHILEDIEARYGRDRLFEVRAVETDHSLIRNYLTPELCQRMDLYVYARTGDAFQVTETGWERVRETILKQLENCGLPYIFAEEENHGQRGELYLRHGYDGVELELTHLRQTMLHLHHIWRRPVHLETVVSARRTLFTCDGKDVTSRVL